MSDINSEIAVLAGGCFWCTEAVFQRLRGVKEVIPGYTGGDIKNPAYREICTGRTGHAEGIKIVFDPMKIDYKSLLEVFFATHDPTTLNRQANDVGTQYRSEIFFQNENQKVIAKNFIDDLNKNNVFGKPVVTAVTEAKTFYNAEEDHINYYNENRTQGYCQVIIDPKIKKLEKYYSNKLL